jgi:glycosyltransferase involved in cell wall biosynthesis
MFNDDKMNRLTAIIPFLNEGAEIERTVASIRDTAGDGVDIMLINDCSEDNTGYNAVAGRYNARYLYNSQRQGVARSRDIGVEMCETQYFILFDGHMRFYRNDWWNAVIEALDNNDRAVYCLRCYPLDGQFGLMKQSHSTGASINMDESSGGSIMDAQWCYSGVSDEALIKIPCVLGACYAMSKRYWKYLRGLTGLRTYGCDETYLSLKTWLEGGACLLMKDIEVGHIFREKAPYSMCTPDLIYNKLLIAETVLPVEHKQTVFRIMHRANPEETDEAIQMLCENRQLVAELKSYYQQIFTWNVEAFIQFNQSMKT